MRFILVALVALLPNNACSGAAHLAASAANDPEVQHRLFHRFHLRVEFDQPVPSQIAPGEQVSLFLQASFESGEPCRFCESSWISSEPEIASFSVVDPCTNGRCSAVLEGQAVGKALLTVNVCQNYESYCQEQQFRLKVRQ